MSRLTGYNRSSESEVIERVLGSLHEAADSQFGTDTSNADSKKFAKTVFTDIADQEAKETNAPVGGHVQEKMASTPVSATPETLIKESPTDDDELSSKLDQALGAEGARKKLDTLSPMLLIVFVLIICVAFYWFTSI